MTVWEENQRIPGQDIVRGMTAAGYNEADDLDEQDFHIILPQQSHCTVA
jgi:hypothetical protein